MKNINQIALLGLLLLSVFSCTIKNKNTSAEVNTLVDSYWMLRSLEGQNIPETVDTRTAYIRFEERDDEVKGYTGCNRLSGKYEYSEAVSPTDESLQMLRMTGLSSTRMMCTNMNQENKLMDILKRVDAYRISDNVLTLYQGDEAVATFMTGTFRSIDNEVNDEVH
ncbi:META domain-containing protein [Pontibacter silvestris]|uniref:META domain-containing protein n=1 Tax=Pontibacter silvestris TaxID=2305183 RepID=A0ABW4X0V0_9BACT|nr:META domain-containing protein [Pontibacter silvestris]MCC9135426.1 META domain-containing protein [Pontibacter silvestris]